MKIKSNPSLRGVANAEAINKAKMDCHDFANAKSRNDEVKRDELPNKSHNDKNYRHFAIFFVGIFGVASLATLALVALLWLYDPFMFFHKPYFREQTIMGDMRVSARGIVEQFDFDSVILGTSMLVNMSANKTSAKLGNKFINFSAAGSNFYVKAIMLDFIIKEKSIKSIIYSIDDFAIVSQSKDGVNAKLYEHIAWRQKLKYYLNKKFIICALKWSKKAECVGNKREFDRIWNGYDNSKENYRGFQSCPTSHKNLFLKQYKLEQQKPFKLPFDSTAQKEFVQKYLIDIIAQNPQIKFHLVLPTNSRYYDIMPFQHGDRQAEDTRDIWLKMIRWLVIEVEPYKNAKIYGFDDLDYADNPSNYNDCYHYNSNMHAMQLDAIANGTHILTPENIDEYLQTMENKIKAYDLAPLIQEIKKWEAKRIKNE